MGFSGFTLQSSSKPSESVGITFIERYIDVSDADGIGSTTRFGKKKLISLRASAGFALP